MLERASRARSRMTVFPGSYSDEETPGIVATGGFDNGLTRAQCRDSY